MKLTFDEKKLLYAYGNPDLALTRKRLYGVAGLTVDPDQNKLVLDFCRKLEDETLADWYDQMFYFVRSEMECYAGYYRLGIAAYRAVSEYRAAYHLGIYHLSGC